MNGRKTTSSPKSFQLHSLVASLEKWLLLCVCVCVCVWHGGKWTRGWGLIAKVNGVVVKKLEMLFTCLSITNPNKLTSQIKQSMAATPDRFGNPRISTVFPTELCCSVAVIKYKLPDFGSRYLLGEHKPSPSDRLQARAVISCHRITSPYPET